MIRACITAILVMMVASCRSPTNYGGIDAETIAQIKILDRYVSQRRLGVEGITALNFLNQRNQYRNLVLIRVTEQRLRIDESPGAYPLLDDKEAQVVQVYKGSLPDRRISLITAHEDIPKAMAVPIGRKFFLFFDERTAAGAIQIDTGALWDYSKDLEALIDDPVTKSYVPPAD